MILSELYVDAHYLETFVSSFEWAMTSFSSYGITWLLRMWNKFLGVNHPFPTLRVKLSLKQPSQFPVVPNIPLVIIAHKSLWVTKVKFMPILYAAKKS